MQKVVNAFVPQFRVRLVTRGNRIVAEDARWLTIRACDGYEEFMMMIFPNFVFLSFCFVDVHLI